MQVSVHLIVKYGSAESQRWWPSFIVANIIGLLSTWLLMLLYKQMHANVALGLAVGLSFMLSQLSLAQWSGVAIISAGIFILAWNSR